MVAPRLIIKITHANIYKFYKVRLNDSIKDIKIKIQDKEGFPVKFQKLFFNKQLLENDKTLSYYQIKKNSNLDLTLESNEKIFVFIQPILGRKITFNLSKNTKIEKLKFKIQKKEIINEQIILKYHNILLEDGKTLKDYNIVNNSIIYLYLKEDYEFIKVHIDFSGRNICLNIINGLSKIRDIKKKLSKIINIPYSELVLYINDKILDDNETLYLDIDGKYTFKLFIKTNTFFAKTSNEIKEDNKANGKDALEKLLMLYECNLRECLNLNDDEDKKLNDNKKLYGYSKPNYGINIFLRGTYSTYCIIFDVYNTVKEFKETIKQEKKIFVNNLTYGGKILKDELTLAEYNVQNNSTIFLL